MFFLFWGDTQRNYFPKIQTPSKLIIFSPKVLKNYTNFQALNKEGMVDLHQFTSMFEPKTRCDIIGLSPLELSSTCFHVVNFNKMLKLIQGHDPPNRYVRTLAQAFDTPQATMLRACIVSFDMQLYQIYTKYGIQCHQF